MAETVNLDGLKGFCERAIKDLEKDAYSMRYERKKKSLGAVLSCMARDHQGLGIYAYFGESDVARMKQHFHVATKLNIASAGLRWGETLSTDANFVYALLSDSAEVIQSYAHLELNDEFIKYRQNPKASQFYVHMIQLAIRDEHEELLAKIAIAVQKANKKIRETYSTGSDFFSLFLKRDKQTLEDHIMQSANEWQGMIKRGVVTNSPLSQDLMASHAMVYAKLCWLKGIEVEIDHPLVPMELLPIKPLEHYDDVYDFLAPDWVPPKPTLLQTFKHIFFK